MTASTMVLKALGTFFLYAVVAMFAQNAVFSRALGVSRLVKMVDDPTIDTFIFGAMLTAVQLISTPLAWYANLLMAPLGSWRPLVRPLIFVLCSGIGFFVVLFFIATVLKQVDAKNAIAALPMATFNCSVLGTMLIAATQNFTLLQTMGFALGSSAGYVLAVMVATEAQRKLQSRAVPACFKGLPITLIYIGVLALAIYGFTGHMLAI
ncbi:MAG: Rnf-Nqr domain containing protein [Oscillospiraceae bacterium]|nr:Rnf-Nqr domain containing protein [Oscillospiraceae bacterium]